MGASSDARLFVIAESAAVTAEMNARPAIAWRPSVHPVKSSVPARADLARGLASDLQREQEMGLQVAPRLVDVELGERHGVVAGTGDQDVVDRRR